MKVINSQKFKSLPEAIFFDLDNTFYSYDNAHMVAMKAVQEKTLKKIGIKENDFYKSFNEAKVIVKNQLGNVAASHSRLLYFAKMFEIIGLKSQVFLSLDLEKTYWRVFLKNATLFDGVEDCLDEIRILGIPMAVITDLTTQIQYEKLIYFNLDNYFDFIVTSEESGFDKPSPESFKLAISKTNLNSNNIWMIGDCPKKDILGARDAIGAVCIQKIHTGVNLGEEDCRPDAFFNYFTDFQQFLKKIEK